ncbi:site-specific integrase [Luteolibacter marinus]|uniref:site-specific integrase n=1 Tax=Luteolibacter marinus TaxID=2776705 RepID=UPI0018687A54|nr:tyrosine-type recombinase/integrase [Luteolibacter marinus]
MATLYRYTDNPQWYARFMDANGKRVSRATGTTKKREADKIANDLEAKEREKKAGASHLPRQFAVIVEAAAREAHAGDLTLARAEELIERLHRLADPNFRVVSLDQHLGEWVATQERDVSEKTARIYKDMRRRVIAAVGPRIAAAPVGELTKRDVEQALSKIHKTKVKGTKRTITAATANMDRSALRRALHAAVEAGLAKANVAATVRPLTQDDSTERAPFTTAEVRAMIDSEKTPDEWKGAILLAAHTGLRLGDVIRLGRAHVEGTNLVIRPEKTKRSRKTLSIPLSPPALGWIGKRKGDFFPTLKGVKTGTLSTQFTRIMGRAGVARDITEAGDVVKRRSFHSLRHSFTSWLADADVHADVRQKLTGHSSAGVHAKYTHHDEALGRAVELLPSFGAQ